MKNDPSLIAHWALNGDASDACGRNHGQARNVTWGAGSNAPPGAHAVPQKWLEIYSNGVFQGYVPCF